MKKWILYFSVAVLIIVISGILGRNDGRRASEAIITNFEKTKQELNNVEMEGLASGLKATAKKLNSKAPIAVDKLTTFIRQEVDGLKVTSFFKLALDKTKISNSDIDAFKKETITQRCKLAGLHDGYKGRIISIYEYRDINDEFLTRIVIDEKACSNHK